MDKAQKHVLTYSDKHFHLGFDVMKRGTGLEGAEAVASQCTWPATRLTF
jgi:hypothetical protein